MACSSAHGCGAAAVASDRTERYGRGVVEVEPSVDAMLMEECAKGGVEIICDAAISEVAHADGAYRVTFPQSKKSVTLKSAWKPNDPVWFGTVGDKRVAVQVRTILNGVNLAYRGIQVPVYVYTEREAALALIRDALARRPSLA